MLRFLLVAGAAVLLAAPAALSAPGYDFGRAGGNIAPYTVTISPGGAVTVSGPAQVGRAKLTATQLASLAAAVKTTRLSALPTRTNCPGTLPDFASRFVTAGGRTVYVRGSCEPRFDRTWHALAVATRLANG